MAKTPTKLEVVAEEMSAEEKLVQATQEAEARIAKMQKEAEEKLAEANRVLADAAKEAAGLKTAAPKKNFRQEMAEAEKLSMKVRMERQFGKDNWIKVRIPAAEGGKDDVMSVTVNGIGYDFARNTVYDMPADLAAIVMGDNL